MGGGYGVGVRLGVSSASLEIALPGFPCWSGYKLEDLENSELDRAGEGAFLTKAFAMQT